VTRAVEYLTGHERGPTYTLIAEMSDEILRLRGAKTAALKISDERAIEAVELREEIASADRACQRLCSKHGYATGHGDTAADMIDEISAQIPLTN
jgi:hypothetical protein